MKQPYLETSMGSSSHAIRVKRRHWPTEAVIQNLGCFRMRPRFCIMARTVTQRSQRDRALHLLKQRGMARLAEFRTAGITAATISRLEEAGEIARLTRGLYQLPDAKVDANHTLAQAAKLVPRGVVCLTSALAFHELIDKIPSKVWLAIGSKDWRPALKYPPVRFARFPDEFLKSGVETHDIEGIPVRMFSVAKTLADVFRYRNTVGSGVAVEGLRAALRERKASPAQIARYANESGIWKVMEPYVTALTQD
jgi:predicted transcriptional regulator of viral defense system